MERVQVPKEGKSRKYQHIARRIGLVMIVMQAVAVTLAMVICINMFNSLVTAMQRERCTNGTNALAYELSRISGDEDMNQILDGLKSRMGCEFTIFEGDTRTYSTVIQDGKRVVGTKLPDNLKKIVLEQGQTYVGEATILGVDYLCSYVPTKGEDGQVNGLIFAGISRVAAEQETDRVIEIATTVSTTVIIICVILMSLYLKIRISGPLDKITKVAMRLEKGDLGLASGEEIQVGIHSKNEIGVLGEIFEETINNLRLYIGEITSVLGSIAEGDLTVEAKADYMGDFLSIKESLNRIHTELNNTMGQIAASAGQISLGADQVASSAQVLAQGATDQASSVQEISATVADISESAQQTSTTAEEAGGFVNQAGAHLGISIDCVKELNVAMENISGTSKEINTIIATIENIAFQINILALNAAVEAARAGTAGKGFAVVAEEVRNLAAKSDEAAKATKELIESSIIAVNEGSDAMGRVTEALEKTGYYAGNVTSKMTILVEEVESQTAAIAQVNEGIEQISAVVETNSATSEECAAASEELSSQAGLLKSLMASFKITGRR
ncbi:MAG: methyl-accepting chemotaxis protein [Lachnospiraceae bacterium]|nr:methyl-accepting chemotaxis protein [Lachnospiraceae bacterium]